MEGDGLVELLEKGRDDLPRGPGEVGGLAAGRAREGDLRVHRH